jgi:hypothetical protein
MKRGAEEMAAVEISHDPALVNTMWPEEAVARQIVGAEAAMMVKLMEKDGLLLRHVDMRVLENHGGLEVVLSALKQNWKAIVHVPAFWQRNREVAQLAVEKAGKDAGEVLEYMQMMDYPAGGHTDISVVKMAYYQNNNSLRYASPLNQKAMVQYHDADPEYASQAVRDEIRAKRQKK